MASRVKRVTVATVSLWEQEAGAVAWNEDRGLGEFEYAPGFLRTGLEIAPLAMPLGSAIFSFPALNRQTFHGLPGLLADALPDRFGNRLIDIWLARQGRAPADFSPVERLCYMGARGMGALEFKPSIGHHAQKSVPLEIQELTQLAADIFKHRTGWSVNLKGDKALALNTIFRVGTSAGGNRAKAVVAWNPTTQEIRSGQGDLPQGYEPWILKFDGVNDVNLGDPQGFGRVEYAYHLMAAAAGISMSPCRLLEEGSRAHFMTRRFDRHGSEKIHVQSVCALGHYDFNAAGEYGYEQTLAMIQRLNLGYPSMQEMFRRMVFNVIARNQDDHTRNIAFLMDKQGRWSLAPAFDVVWAYNPSGAWTNRHQMSINGKRDEFSMSDFLAVAELYDLSGAKDIVAAVGGAVARWKEFAGEAGVPSDLLNAIKKTHRLRLVMKP
jgi:serine/threonine-protein kinase HipA